MATLTHRQTLVRAKTHVGAMGSLGLAFQAAATDALQVQGYAVVRAFAPKSHAFFPTSHTSMCGRVKRRGLGGGTGRDIPECGNCAKLVSAVKS